MKPYLAILYDSLIEAINSKVLWILLLLWVLILGAIAPFAFIQDISYRFSSSEIVGQDDAVPAKLAQALSKSRGTPAQLAVANALSDASKKKITEAADKQKPLRRGEVAELLNEALVNPKLYQEDAWPKADRRSDLKEILAKTPEQRSDRERDHLHRRLIEQAFSGSIQPVNENRVWIGYAGFKISDDPLPASLQQARDFIESFVLQFILKIGLGVFAIGASIVVTSAMIPDMFQTGSLHLLLSKPISRSWLFLAKFLGGCIFVAINIAFFLTGLYFVAGIRLGIWNQGLLATIPVCVFIFIIFYTVSALTGLIWRNAIISIAMTALFWLFCWFMGTVHDVMYPFAEIFPQITEVQPVDKYFVGTQQAGQLVVWNESTNKWQPVFDTRRGGPDVRALGPYWFPEEGELYYAKPQRRAFGGFEGDISPTLVSLPELSSDPAKRSDASSSLDSLFNDSRTDDAPKFPSRTRRVIKFQNDILLLTDQGIFRMDRSIQIPKAEKGNVISGFLEQVMQRASKNEAFKKITADDWLPKSPMDFAFNGDTILVYSHGKLARLKEDAEKRWQVEAEIELTDDKSTPGILAINRDHWLLVAKDSKTWFGPISDLNAHQALSNLSFDSPRRLSTDPKNGDFFLISDEGKLWKIRHDGSDVSQPSLAGQGKLTVATPLEDGQVLLAEGIGNVSRWNPATNATEILIRPKLSVLQQIFRYAVHPLYFINPKPAAMDNTISYLLTKKKSAGFEFDTASLEEAKPITDPWQPLWSNSFFIGIMLLICCLYLYRQDL